KAGAMSKVCRPKHRPAWMNLELFLSPEQLAHGAVLFAGSRAGGLECDRRPCTGSVSLLGGGVREIDHRPIVAAGAATGLLDRPRVFLDQSRGLLQELLLPRAERVQHGRRRALGPG